MSFDGDNVMRYSCGACSHCHPGVDVSECLVFADCVRLPYLTACSPLLSSPLFVNATTQHDPTPTLPGRSLAPSPCAKCFLALSHAWLSAPNGNREDDGYGTAPDRRRGIDGRLCP